jgi:hypothetical protein
MTNWEGKAELRQYILNEAPRYGNGNDYNDKYLAWVGDTFAELVNSASGPRGPFSAGLFPVAFNVLYGLSTAATPDGRMLGEPLSDGISPMQQMDKNGPTAILASVSRLDQSKYPNGTLLNYEVSPDGPEHRRQPAQAQSAHPDVFRDGRHGDADQTWSAARSCAARRKIGEIQGPRCPRRGILGVFRGTCAGKPGGPHPAYGAVHKTDGQSAAEQPGPEADKT